jgi:hypothetical protein
MTGGTYVDTLLEWPPVCVCVFVPEPARTLVLIFMTFSFRCAVPALFSADPMPADS